MILQTSGTDCANRTILTSPNPSKDVGYHPATRRVVAVEEEPLIVVTSRTSCTSAVLPSWFSSRFRHTEPLWPASAS